MLRYFQKSDLTLEIILDTYLISSFQVSLPYRNVASKSEPNRRRVTIRVILEFIWLHEFEGDDDKLHQTAAEEWNQKTAHSSQRWSVDWEYSATHEYAVSIEVS